MTVGPDASDAELLDAHTRGDPDAFGALVRRHQDRLWAVALRTTGNPDDAADALQDGLLNAYRRAATFRGEAAVTTWLHRIVVNACLDRARRAAVRPPVVDTDALPPVSVPAASDDIPARLDVLAALAQLPPEQRAVLVLVDVEGWSVEDAAAMLDCPVGTVKSRGARGRARLRAMLPGYGPAGAPAPTGNPGPSAGVSSLTGPTPEPTGGGR